MDGKHYDTADAFCSSIDHPENKHLRTRIESVTRIKYASDALVPRESNWEYHPVNTKLNHERELKMQVDLDWRRRIRQCLGTVDGALSQYKETEICSKNGDQVVNGKKIYLKAGASAEKIQEVRTDLKRNWDLRNHTPIKADEKVVAAVKDAEKQLGNLRKVNRVFLTKTELAERKRLQKLKDDIWKKRKEEEHKAVYGEEK